ncbi:hypothetical protein B0G69_5110 [Paraburkholderia sp. RAU2J]|uniref:hypothetical protein n=1 Tax=Paraburkholderia sp. RAU2J TaxID=1938810 RepID=UPI000F0F8919|nr:hypothetical protein [Paraburkholderia sp. RAU2J]RKT21708.1 hypothetical protein B0G69_5110 [Paraburkholderia sp. RAU2J]
MWASNLYRAFSILLVGSPVEIGSGYRWKSGLLRLVIVLSACFPYVNALYAGAYKGDLPPLTPLISGNGHIEFRREYKRPDYAVFLDEDGKSYVFQDYSSLHAIRDFVTEHPDQRLHVKGFILKNGEGFFWPTSISTIDGQILLAPDELSRELENHRDIWGGLLAIQQISLLPLWIISFFNVVKIARRLKKGEIQ